MKFHGVPVAVWMAWPAPVRTPAAKHTVIRALTRFEPLKQAEIALQIYKWRAAGWSAQRIARRLNDTGVPSPGSTWNRTNTVPDKLWTEVQIIQIARNARLDAVRRGVIKGRNKDHKGLMTYASGHDSKYWLGTILVCGECGPSSEPARN